MNKRGGFGKVLGWLFLFVVGSLIVAFLVSPNSFNNFKQNIKSIIPNSISSNVISNNLSTNSNVDSLLNKCKISFNQCKDIAEQKYGISISLLHIQKFEDETSANDFFNTWKSPTQYAFGQIIYGVGTGMFDNEIGLPTILIAASIRGNAGQLPVVVGCDTDGSLFPGSKAELLC
ncbi:MAG: hypothetical protein PHH00_03205 [Candidatus Nanoarchaeia archaeon]|nr:hypothetical protein [Candidatus Nanoarchaeia archaeon]